MNERLTYFCERATGHCHLYAWTGSGATHDGAANGPEASLYQVFCRTPLNDSWPDTSAGAGDLEAVRRRVAAAGGGLIAQTSRTADRTILRVESVPGSGYDPATDLLLLNPGREPEPLPLPERAITLAPGAFVLLPATRTDQSSLLAFVDQLHRLPGDYRGLLLNVLRRPGIEATIGRLEQRLDLLDRRLAPAAALAGEATAPAASNRDRWPWLLAGLLVLNLLGSLAAALWLKGALGSLTRQPGYHFELPLNLPPAPGILNLPLTPAIGGSPTDRHPPRTGTGQPAAGPGPDSKPDAK
jgi:hypothetical protein